MAGRLRRRVTPIGLDWDGRFMMAVQLARGGEGLRLTHAVRIERTTGEGVPGEEEAGRLRRILTRHGFRGSQVVLALDESRLMTAVLELPPRSSGAPLAEIAAAELTRMNGCTPHQAEAAFWELPDAGHAGEAAQALAVGCRHDVAEAALKPFEAAGLEPVALDSALHAAVRACRPTVPTDGNVAVLDLGWDRALLAIVRGGRIQYRKPLPDASMLRLWELLGGRLGLGPDGVDCLLAPDSASGADAADASLDAVHAVIDRHGRALADALEAPFAYAAGQRGGSPVAEVLLTGLGAAVPGIAHVLGSSLAAGARAVTPADVVAVIREDVREASADPSLITAIGLACFREDGRR